MTLLVKRTLDILLGTLLLLLLAVPMVGIACAVRLCSPGPALYVTMRHGRGGKPFGMLKFRTMRVATAAQSEAFRATVARTGVLPKSAADPRVTRLGRWLRRSSLDELPQFMNVIAGHMALVGPRAIMPEMLAHDPKFARDRAVVRPGITGLWQVTARHKSGSVDDMKLPDLEYIARLSLGLDLAILLRTMVVVARGDGAF
ncbi:sugar transferase [Sphingomonas bacterium]|uniref:sugar transferase n=1 Tax=Sphingomonas bacterium TaxID=1895847 RepID=UPI00157717CE|nr:sugar transferase [Sphingomonas bacterium]